jgi:hypothetical protein
MIVHVSEVAKQPASVMPYSDCRRFYSRSQLYDTKIVQLFVFPNSLDNTLRSVGGGGSPKPKSLFRSNVPELAFPVKEPVGWENHHAAVVRN